MTSHSTITSQALAPLKPRRGPTEQSRLLSPLPGTAMRAKCIHHDRTWDHSFPTQTSFTFPVPAPSRSSGKNCFCPFPTFIQQEPQQHQLRQKVFGKAKQEAAKIQVLSHRVVSHQGPEGCAMDGGLWRQRPRSCSDKGQNSVFFCCFRRNASILCSSVPSQLRIRRCKASKASV